MVDNDSGYYIMLPTDPCFVTCPGCGKYKVIWRKKPTGAAVAYLGGLPNWACFGVYCDLPIPQEKEK